MKKLFDKLASEGGCIVSSNECTEMEIADANIRGDFFVDDEGLGYVRRTQKWLDLHKFIQMPNNDHIQDYINNLPWTPAATEEEKSLVACNILNFYQWLIGARR